MARAQPSSIDKLPEEVRAAIGRLRAQGRTLDEILAHLGMMDVDVSRSALGRHVKKMATVSERLKSSRDMAIALAERFGEQPDNRIASFNIEMMHAIMMEVMTATTVDEETGETQPITLDPEQAMFLARALKDLAGAQKTNSDRTIIVKRELAKDAAKAVDKVAKRDGGLTRETIDAIKKEILGIAA
jgi:hypothetical protein